MTFDRNVHCNRVGMFQFSCRFCLLSRYRLSNCIPKIIIIIKKDKFILPYA